MVLLIRALAVLGLLAATSASAQENASAMPAPTTAAPPLPRPPPPVSAFYPERAQRMNQSGRVLLGCAAEPAEQLTDCRVILETPQGWDFGEAALKAIRRGSVQRPKTSEKSKDGRILVTVNFTP